MNEKNIKPYFSVEEVRKNKYKTVFLVLVLATIAFVLSVGIGYIAGDLSYGITIGLVISLIVIPVQLVTAKASILAMARGKKLDETNERHRRLRSIAEGLAVSAGLKRVPDLYIVPSDVPNAFASGMSEKDAFVCVTQGLLDRLDDQELAGVVAHEISHIVHRDIMLSQLTVSLVSVIILLSSILTRMTYFGSGRKNKDNDNAGAIILAIALIGILLQPFARIVASLIELSISRKREYAADAYAVRLCGYNEGLARALEKIGGVGKYCKEQVESLGGAQLKCMYINFPSAATLFSTHPPIEERVKRIRNMY